eukprot:XP_008765726.1 PREDICTED: uncharacterized protein LOC103693267 [Rattus norvegicus]
MIPLPNKVQRKSLPNRGEAFPTATLEPPLSCLLGSPPWGCGCSQQDLVYFSIRGVGTVNKTLCILPSGLWVQSTRPSVSLVGVVGTVNKIVSILHGECGYSQQDPLYPLWGCGYSQQDRLYPPWGVWVQSTRLSVSLVGVWVQSTRPSLSSMGSVGTVNKTLCIPCGGVGTVNKTISILHGECGYSQQDHLYPPRGVWVQSTRPCLPLHGECGYSQQDPLYPLWGVWVQSTRPSLSSMGSVGTVNKTLSILHGECGYSQQDSLYPSWGCGYSQQDPLYPSWGVGTVNKTLSIPRGVWVQLTTSARSSCKQVQLTSLGGQLFGLVLY